MTGRIVGHAPKARYYLDGVEVTKEQFDASFPDQPLGGGDPLCAFPPLHSEALAVHPDQIPEAVEDAKRKDVPTEFDPEGRPIFTSSAHFRKYARAYGFRHKSYW